MGDRQATTPVRAIEDWGDVCPDPKNANKGTPRGQQMIEDSLRQFGAGRSILVDRDGVIVAGNKTAETAMALGLPLRVVQSDGTAIVAVQRTDLSIAEGDRARLLAYSDNRSSQVSLEWELAQVAADIEDGVDLSGMFTEGELAALLGRVDEGEWADALGGLPSGDKSDFEQMTFTVNGEQAAAIRAALARAKGDGPFVDTGNENSNGNALARVCESYVG
jgi:hypothetical protein